MTDMESGPLIHEEPSTETPALSKNGQNGASNAALPLWHPDTPFPETLQIVLKNLKKQDVPPEEQDKVVRAFRFAAEAHKDQARKDGTPYIYHPLEVARIISDHIGDPDMLCAAIMHDLIEDCGVTFDDVATRFSPDIARMVEGVTKLSKLQVKDATERMAESTKKMLYAMAQDIRVLLIKLADRLHNMRTLEHLREEKRHTIAHETLDFYAPLAHRLGMYRLKSELEDLSFKNLYPQDYRQLSDLVAMKRGERDRIVTDAVSAVKHLLAQKGIECSVKGRAKHLYSIWRKMERDDLSFDQLYDLFALRIVIAGDDEGDCYRVLGLVHSVWQPIYEKLKDYIGRPKSNGYQSLHTVVIGPEGRPLEIQIRTDRMNQQAEFGIAAHFLYKENRDSLSEVDQKLSWLRNLLDWEREENPGAAAYMEGLKTDLVTEEVLVFTPKGDVLSLPMGSTPIDFAYLIHTDVGHSTRQAFVNGKIAPLNTILQNGDIVELVTRKDAKAPPRDWLSFVASNRAASKIRAYYKKLDYDVNIQAGKDDLSKEERRAGLTTLKLTAEANIRKALPDLGVKKLESLYAAIGRGDISAKQVLIVLRERLVTELKKKSSTAKTAPLTDRVPLEGTAGSFGVIIDGATDVTIHLARCCLPVHGDPITGYVTKSRGIAIHRDDCKTLSSKSLAEGRMSPASWSPKPVGMYLAAVDLWVLDRVGLLSDVTQGVADTGVNVSGLKITLAKDKTARMRIRVQVASLAELQKVIRRLTRVSDVLEAKRAAGM